MKNNHGQTLILFIFILPIILSLVLLLINYSVLSSEKLKLENNLKSAIEYGLNLKLNNTAIEDGYLTNDEIKNKIDYLLKQNITYDTLDIIVNDTNIMITLTKKNDSFTKILAFFPNYIELKFYGMIQNDQIKIERR